MRKLATVIVSILMVMPAWAHENGDDLLDKVKISLSSEQYVTTKTALVTIAVNATVNENDLDKIQDTVLKKMAQFSNQGEWHIVSFDRSVDQSGLEKVRISGQARLPSAALIGLRDKAKTMTKPGETFTLDNVQFTPSEDEIRAAMVVLRSNIYQQAKEEVERLNKLYPEQKFYVHNVDFVRSIEPVPMPQNNMMASMRMVGGSAEPLLVGDKMTVTATVTLASAAPMPEHGLIKNIT